MVVINFIKSMYTVELHDDINAYNEILPQIHKILLYFFQFIMKILGQKICVYFHSWFLHTDIDKLIAGR